MVSYNCPKCHGLLVPSTQEVYCVCCGLVLFKPRAPEMSHMENVAWWAANKDKPGRQRSTHAKL